MKKLDYFERPIVSDEEEDLPRAVRLFVSQYLEKVFPSWLSTSKDVMYAFSASL